MRPGHVGGLLEVAAEWVEFGGDEVVESHEEFGGFLLGVALQGVGLAVFGGEGGDGADLGGADAFELHFGGLAFFAAELAVGIHGEGDEVIQGLGGETTADAEGFLLRGVAGEGASGSYLDGGEGSLELGAGGGFIQGAAALAGAGGGDLGDVTVRAGDVGAEVGLLCSVPFAFGEGGGVLGFGGFIAVVFGVMDGVKDGFADEAGFGAFGLFSGGFRRRGGGCGGVWHGGGVVGMKDEGRGKGDAAGVFSEWIGLGAKWALIRASGGLVRGSGGFVRVSGTFVRKNDRLVQASAMAVRVPATSIMGSASAFPSAGSEIHAPAMVIRGDAPTVR